MAHFNNMNNGADDDDNNNTVKPALNGPFIKRNMS